MRFPFRYRLIQADRQYRGHRGTEHLFYKVMGICGIGKTVLALSSMRFGLKRTVAIMPLNRLTQPLPYQSHQRRVPYLPAYPYCKQQIKQDTAPPVDIDTLDDFENMDITDDTK